MTEDLRIRPYGDDDAASTLGVYRRAIQQTAAGAYTSEQRQAWLSSTPALPEWNRRLATARTSVATLDGAISGFLSLLDAPDSTAHIDMLFVEPGAGRKGVGTALLHAALTQATYENVQRLTVDASYTLRPLLERNEFVVDAEQTVVRSGVALTNFRMHRVRPAERNVAAVTSR